MRWQRAIGVALLRHRVLHKKILVPQAKRTNKVNEIFFLTDKLLDRTSTN